MTVTTQYQEPKPRTTLWVFGRGDVPAQPNDANGPPAPAWAGTGSAWRRSWRATLSR